MTTGDQLTAGQLEELRRTCKECRRLIAHEIEVLETNVSFLDIGVNGYLLTERSAVAQCSIHGKKG